MGIRTSLNEAGKPAAQANLRKVNLGVDVPLFLALFTILVFGLLILYSASWDFSRYVRADSDPYYIFNRQLLWLVLGLAGSVFATWFSYKYVAKLASWGMAATLVMLLMVLLFGETVLGAKRSLFGGSIQPSELSKVMVVVYLAVWLNA